jgi:hypothetical protein
MRRERGRFCYARNWMDPDGRDGDADAVIVHAFGLDGVIERRHTLADKWKQP